MELQNVTTNFYANNQSIQWKEPFNQATFFNYDTNSAVTIERWTLQPAQLIGGRPYPTFLEISLNAGEINTTNFRVDTLGSSTADWRVIYTQYEGVQ